MRVAICAGPATTGKTSVLRHSTRKLLAGRPPAGVPEARRAVRRRGRAARQGVRHSHAEGLFRRALPRPLQRDGPGRRAALGRAERLRHAAGRDGRPLPALLALRRRRPGPGRARSHQRHEPAAEGRADALAGRRGRGDQDRPRFAGRARGVPRADSGRRPDGPRPRGQRPARHRHRSAGGRDPRDAARSTGRCSCAAIRRWAPARSASARRKSAGSRTSAWSGRWKTRRSIAESERCRRASTSTTPPRRRSIRACCEADAAVSRRGSGAIRRACISEGREAREAVEAAEARWPRCSAPSRARSSSPAAAPRPTTWRSGASLLAAADRPCHVVTSAIEHPAVLECCRRPASGWASR